MPHTKIARYTSKAVQGLIRKSASKLAKIITPSRYYSSEIEKAADEFGVQIDKSAR